MKAGLGDDAQDGWLLLGSQGVTRNGGQSTTLAGAGSQLSVHNAIYAAAAGAVLSASLSAGGGGVNSGSRNPAAPSQRR